MLAAPSSESDEFNLPAVRYRTAATKPDFADITSARLDDGPSMTGDPSEKPIFQTLDRTEAFPYSTREYVRRYGWLVIQATLYRLPLPRAYAWRRFWLRCFGAKLGTAAAVHATTRILHPWLLETGHWSTLSSGVIVYNLGPVKTGRHTVISQDAYLCAGTHD